MICDQKSLSNLDDKCIRRVWRALLPSVILTSIFLYALVAFILHTPAISSRIYSLKSLRRIRRSLRPFLDLHQAEDLLASSSREQGTPLASTGLPSAQHGIGKDSPARPRAVERWSAKFHAVRLAVPLFLGGLLETLVWILIACYELASSSTADPGSGSGSRSRTHISSSIAAFIIASVWAYIPLRVAFSPSIRVHARPPPDILILLLTLGTAATVDGAGRAYETYVHGREWVPVRTMGWCLVDVGIVCALTWVIILTPLELPGERVNFEAIGHEVSPEDYASIWGWMSFSFVTPLIKQGTATTLNEDDVWEVSPHHRAGPLLSRYMSVKGKTLLRKLWIVNSLDLIMDALLTIVAVLFNYAGPFFLKQILEAIDNPSREARARAYVYALLTFLASLIKTQADMHHLWYGRQAVTRTRSLLMAAVYDKALKRKDFSGTVATSTSAKALGGCSIKKAVLEQVGKGKNKSSKPSAGADIGKIVNLMSGDASKVSQIFGNLYNLYGAPFEIIIASVFLYQLLGYSAFLGFFTLVLFTPLNHKLSTRRIFISRGISTARDRRMAVLNELFVSVKFIKLCAWDGRWINRAEHARKKELKWIGMERWNTIWLGFLWTAAPILVSVVSFAVFVVIEQRDLSIAIAFTSIVLFNQLRQPLNVLPNFMAQILQARVALERLSGFFSEEEVESFVSSLKQPPPTTSSESISFDVPTLGITGGARFMWNSVEQPDANPTITVVAPADNGDGTVESPVDERRFELKDIDIIFPPGKLTLVTGATASGKTALLMALLGEMTPSPSPSSRAQVHLPKLPYSALDEYGLRSTVSYAAQTPWLEHLSIRENILFGSPFEEDRYWEVIECCALGPDLAMLEDGDATEIGERGISLSGGQKARVALARAVYARSRCVLLDDPLSAVDSHTARFLFERLFQGELLKHRTVVLVTHHVELVLPGAYYLVHMAEGEIVTQGTVTDLRATGLLAGVAGLTSEKDRKRNAHDSTSDSSEDGVTGDDERSSNSDEDTGRMAKKVHDIIEQLRTKDRERQGKTGRKLVQAEERQTGNVKWEIYDTYFKASSYLTWVAILALIVVSQLFGFFEKFWLKVWGEAYNHAVSGVSDLFHSESEQLAFQEISSPPPYMHAFLVNPNIFSTYRLTLPPAYRDPLPYVLIYAAIGLAGVVITTINTVVQYHGAIRASKLLFTRLLNTVVHATMRWHDVTPTGRILNRLSRDMEVLDSSLSNSLRAVLFRLATFIASIMTVAYVFPIFLIPACVISFFYYQISKGYVNAGRDMRRMQSTTRSPIFAGFAETLEGIVTVRAFSAERRFIGTLVQKVDLSMKMWYGFWMLNRWLLLRFDGLGALSIFLITIFALAGYVSGGWAGITITSAMQFTVSVYWTCRFATQLELDLNSVERIVEYLDLPQEPPNKVAGKEIPAAWPSITTVGPAGTPEKPFIIVEDLTIRYSPELPPVLHGVSFELKAGEKIGLLGRTGSGKSTLAMSLLRFTDPSSGRIIIDGVDICEIGVGDLRSKLTIIPQDSVLFSGTLRENLDPFDDYSDADCLDALYRVHLLTPTIPSNATATIRKSRRADVAQLLFDRPQTPEPESMSEGQPDLSSLTRKLTNPLKRRARHLYASETLMVPAIGHTGGTVTPVHMEGDREGSPDDGEMSERERDGVRQMYQTSTQSGIASPIPTRGRRLSGSDLSPIADSGEESGTSSRRGSMVPERPVGANRPRPGSGTGEMLSLETRVASGGANFSNGQRQLVSMARALLRRNAVVILDEATSSIDFETDAKIQATVRQEFRASCLITIAHRIRTVIDYDRLIVLDKGRIVEFDTPWNLIQKEGGVFRDMCMNSGMMGELQSLAKAKLMGSGTW